MKWFVGILSIGLLVPPAASGATEDSKAGVSVTVAPQTVWIVPGDGTQKIQFDFLARNEGPEPMEIDAIRLEVLDAEGLFVTGRELNRMGMCPSTGTLPFTEVEPGRTVILFNPFFEFPGGMEIETLRYTLTFVPKEDDPEGETEVAEKVEVGVTVLPELIRIQTPLFLPLKGKVFVWDGYDFYAHHRRLDLVHPLITQLGVRHNITRYGMDFMETDAAGNRFQDEGKRSADYYIYGKTVFAPAEGVVTDCIDGRPDSPIGKMLVDYEELMRTKNLKLLGGNFIILDHGNGEFSYMAHLKDGSLTVKKGDRVSRGQPIAQVGNSGDSLEPHLHYHLMSSSEFDCEQIPAVFRDFTRHYGSRAVRVEAGCVDTGDVVESLATRPSNIE